jgi:NHLM bacteriocin system ABC transporter peptidase/ATP-binding protein
MQIAQKLRRRRQNRAKTKRVRTPTVLQMEAVECGAASLGIILGYYGRFVPLEELRAVCGVSRDGSKASNVLKAARRYGLAAKGYRKEVDDLRSMKLPVVVFWNFNHFLVVEGFGDGKVYLNDPAIGPRTVSDEEFDLAFTGVVLTFEPTEDFEKGDTTPGFFDALRKRLRGSELGLLYIVLTSLTLVIPGLVVPAYSMIFVDDFLVAGRDIILPLLVAMALTGVIIGVLTWLRDKHLLRMETKLALSTSSQFFWHVLRLPMQFFTQRYSGEISARIEANDRIARLLSGELATTLLNVVLIAFYAVLMVQYDVILTLIGVAAALLNILILSYFARKYNDAVQRLLQEDGKLTGMAMSGLRNIEVLKARGAEDDFFTALASHNAKSIRAEQHLRILLQVLAAIPPALTTLSIAAILIIGSVRVVDGQMSVGMLVAFQALMLSFLGPVAGLVNFGSQIQEVRAGMARIDDVVRHDEAPLLDGPAVEASSAAKLAGYVELKNVTFGYNRFDPPLIEGFRLTLQPGDSVALVGRSGSGKSTIAKLIAGLYEVWDGEILFDGKPRSVIPRTTITNSLAMVDQDIFMFEGTVRENLTLWDSTLEQTQIIQAAKDACIHEDIALRPGGYGSQVAEEGRNFSGGQRQRMEIARVLANDPSILILDEATSALDPVTEKEIAEQLKRRGCTLIIVAHRLSTIRDCDEIIVLEDGTIVQRGAHEALYRIRDGAYARLIRAEAADEEDNLMTSIFDQLA